MRGIQHLEIIIEDYKKFRGDWPLEDIIDQIYMDGTINKEENDLLFKWYGLN